MKEDKLFFLIDCYYDEPTRIMEIIIENDPQLRRLKAYLDKIIYDRLKKDNIEPVWYTRNIYTGELIPFDKEYKEEHLPFIPQSYPTWESFW